jgi:hypothetical protein
MASAPSPNSFDSALFLDLARELAERSDEAALRTAVGRAYYAAFLIAKQRTMVVQKEGVHDEVRSRVRNRPPRGKHLADQLRELFQLRNVADYEVVPEEAARGDWRANWERAELLADTLIPRLRAL